MSDGTTERVRSGDPALRMCCVVPIRPVSTDHPDGPEPGIWVDPQRWELSRGATAREAALPIQTRTCFGCRRQAVVF